MINLSVENVYTRHTAKELTKKHFWKLLGMMLLVFLIAMAISFVGTALLSLHTGSTTEDVFYLLGCLLLMLISTLVSSGLNLGYTASMLDICRGDEDVTVGRVFSRMGSCLKGFGLNIWVGLKVLAWALPVYLVIGFIGAAVVMSQSSTVDSLTGIQSIPLNSEFLTMLLTMLPLIAVIFVFALVIPAAFRYMLSAQVLADEPATGVFECVRKSKAMMKGHKWQAFKLNIPMLLTVYLIMFGILFVLMIGTAVFAETSPVALSVLSIVLAVAMVVVLLMYAMRVTLSYCLFYLKRKGEVPPAPVEEEERIVCWMPTDSANNPQ